jgi:hypothetical protein
MERVPARTVEVWFTIEMDKPVRVHIEGKDIEVLRRAALDVLDAECAIPWVDYYHVHVFSPREYDADFGASLSVGARLVQIATLPDGTEIWRDSSKRSRRHGTPVRVQTGRPVVGTEDDGCWSLMLCTEETTLQVRMLVQQLGLVRESVDELLSSDNIAATLKRVGMNQDPLSLGATTPARKKKR